MLKINTGKNQISSSKVLLIVLLSGVLWYVFPRGEGDPTNSLVTELAQNVISQALSLPAEKSAAGNIEEWGLQPLPLAELVDTNPFRLPKSPQPELPPDSPEAESTEQITSSEPEFDPSQLKVSAIIADGPRNMALIDSVLYRQGDYLPNGMRIDLITPSSIRLSPAP